MAEAASVNWSATVSNWEQMYWAAADELPVPPRSGARSEAEHDGADISLESEDGSEGVGGIESGKSEYGGREKG